MSAGAYPPSAEGKTVQIRRRSRPWLPLWGSWRVISEPERAFAVANMEKVRRLRLGTLSVTAFSRDSSPIGRAKGRALPAQSRPAQSAEPGDPQRCGLAAKVAGSSLPAGAPRRPYLLHTVSCKAANLSAMHTTQASREVGIRVGFRGHMWQ